MVGQRKTDFIGKEIDYAKMKRKENIKKNQNIPIIKKIRFNQRYSFIINFILFEFIFILLPKRICSDEHYIEITVNKAGYNQILSDEYEGILPSEVQVNDVNTFIINKKVYVESVFDTIYLKFDRTISDFFYMFNNLDTISSVHMHYMFGKDNNMSYMFNNCHNLQTFTYETFRSISYTIIDMKGMFFNCHSLQSFKFHDLFMDCYETVTTSSIDENGKNVGQVAFDGSVVSGGEIIGYALYDFYAYDENFIVYGYFTKDGTVLSSVGSKLGVLEHGFVIDRNNKPVARGNRDYTVRDVSNNAIGELGFDVNVTDYENQNIGYLADDGAIKNSNGDTIARAYSLQYYSGQHTYRGSGDEWADNKKVGVQDESRKDSGKTGSVVKDLSRKIIGIALSPDGDIIGDIYDDNTVRDANGVQKGFRTSDGIIVDMDYNPIGIEEIKRTSAESMFVPAGTFGNGNAYGIGSQPSNLGPGGGFGQGERYDPERARALSQLQQMRRKNISVKPISSNFEVSSFTGYEEDGWPGVEKNISSWRVDMSEMILEDKPIPAVLARSVYASESFSQNVPVTAIVERNIYAEDGRNIIIPAGSRAIGFVNGGGVNSGGNSGGAVKIGISWKRIIRPDGAQFLLNSAQTADAQGRAGAICYLDEQLLKKYSTPLMMTALEGATAYAIASSGGTTTHANGTTTSDDKSKAADDARQQMMEKMQDIFDEILRDKANIKAVTYVPAGTRIIIFPNEDLWLNNEKRNLERKDIQVESAERGLTTENTDARSGTISAGSSGGGNKINYDEEYEEEVAPASLTTNNPTNANTRRRRQGTVPAATQQSTPSSSGSSTSAVPDLM